ncbi:MAG: hypothetical protein NTX31_00005 [Burkholderiales bacterium]|nr:hypothetical protein [Burkholderiales bacterium]
MNLLTWLTAQAAGLGLETDMSPKQTGGVDKDADPNADPAVAPYGVPPHPANEAFAKGMEAVLMKTVGMNLSSITTSENFPWAAIQIRDYFAGHFEGQLAAPAKPNVPKFLLPPEQRVTPVTVPAAFRYRLDSLEPAPPNQTCAAVRNLDWLTEAFHLSSAERKVLLWTYIANRMLPSVIEGVMSEIQCLNERQAQAALSLLLDETESEIAKCFSAPCRLRGMRLIDSHPWRYPLTLDSFFQGTENLTDVLEVVHYSRAGMLQRLSELSLYWSMLPDPGVPDERLHRWFKPAMAEACIATANDQPLTAAHIVELVWWLIGYRMPAEQFEPLAGNIEFLTIQKAIQRCCMERSQSDQAVTQLAVMQALYAAVQ